MRRIAGTPLDSVNTGHPGAEPLETMIAAQDGVLSRDQAIGHGLSPAAVDRRLVARHWEPLHPKVYRDVRYPGTAAGRVRAALLWAGEHAVLSGQAAAWWWGLPGDPPAAVTVTVPRRRSPRARPGIPVRRRDLGPDDVVEHRGVTVVVPALAALETALELGGAGESFLVAVLTAAPGRARSGGGEHGADPAPPNVEALVATQARHRGAQGAAPIGRMLVSACRRAATYGVHATREILTDARISGWTCSYDVCGVVLPIAFPAARIAVEIRGATPDGDGRWRQAVLRRQGWHLVVLDPADPLCRPGATLTTLRDALAGRPPEPGGSTARAAA